MMFGRNQTWTGIDLGADRIKLVHGQGGQRFEKITHIGTEPWGRRASDDPVQSASAAKLASPS